MPSGESIQRKLINKPDLVYYIVPFEKNLLSFWKASLHNGQALSLVTFEETYIETLAENSLQLWLFQPPSQI